VSWWTGDKNENDVIGNNNPSAVNAVTLVSGEVKSGFTFGTNGYIEIPAATDLANQQFTWAAWVQPNGPGSTDDQFGSVILLENSTTISDVVALDWRDKPDDRFLFVFGNQDSETIYSKDTFPPGAFYFVVGTYNGSVFTLYVNGAVEASFAESKTIAYTSYPWVIGESVIAGPGFRTWNGIIDEVQAYSVALSQSQIQAIYKAGRGGVCKGLTASPTSLQFPRQTIGTSSPAKTVTLTNAFPLPVAVKTVTTTGDFAQTNTCPVSPAKLASGTTCTVSVKFTPTAIGARTGKLTLTENAPASPLIVNLTGLATDVSLSASSLGFGVHKVGTTTAAKKVTITNDSNRIVTFTGSRITLGGTHPLDYLISGNTCGASLSPGANCTVSVEFQPLATGARNATLQFFDDGGESPQTVALIGTGS
jgi:hypothetical protein